jgi:chemotaxis protein methyltransferase CheR
LNNEQIDLGNIREFSYTWDDFNILRRISNMHSGILVPDDKFDMFYSRLVKRLRVLALSDFRAYCQFLVNNPEQEFTEFINAITTNLTSFFREQHHFEYLQTVLIPELLEKNRLKKQIKVWSAGCSTGEEPYSIAIILAENVPVDWDIIILATDLDTNVLTSASNGIYSTDRVVGISQQRLRCWFQKGLGRNTNRVRIKPEIQKKVRFRQLNLVQSWPMKSGFDFIFCRNVLIYFDRETKERLAKRFAELLDYDARLFIGHSESLHQLDCGFKLIGQSIYRKNSK